MVTFAPDLPQTTPPDWTNVVRPVQQPESDKSSGLRLDTAGTILSGAVKTAEELDRSNIEEKTRAGVDAIRDTTTLAYQNIRDAQMTGQSPAEAAARTAGFTGSLIQPGAGEVPPGLQSGIDRAGDIGTAMAQGTNKNNDTLYTANLNALSKQLRSQYPGHVDFIDEQMSKISGKNPANAYMDNLLQDINRNQAAAASGKNRLLTKAYDHLGDQDSNGRTTWTYIKAFEHGLPGSEDNLANYVSKLEADKSKFDHWKQQNEMNVGNRANDVDLAKSQMQQHLAAASQRNFNGILDNAGLSSPETMQRLVTASQNGQITLSTDQKNQLLSSTQAAKVAFLNEARKINNDYGYSTRVNDPAAEKAIIANAGANFDTAIDNITNEHYGSLFENKRAVEGMQDDTNQQVLSNKDIGAYTRELAAMTKFAGPEWVNIAQSAGLNKGMLGKFQNFATQATMEAQTPDDLRNDGKVKSMYSHIQQLQQYDADQKRLGHSAASPAVYNDVVHNVDAITDPKTPPQVKAEIAKYAFNEQNWKLMDAFKMDFTDSKNVQHKGKYSVFDTMTQPGVTDNIWNLKDRSTWGMYKNWGETSFNTLYREELQNLNNLGNTSLPIRVLWDARNSRFDLDDGKGGPLQPTMTGQGMTTLDQNFIDGLKSSVNRLNSGLYNLKNIYAKEGGNTSEHLLQSMTQMGFNPSDKVQGLSSEMYQAILASKKKQDLSTAFEKAKNQ